MIAYNDPTVTLKYIITNTATTTAIQYNSDSVITSTVCPVVHLFTSTQSGESNDRV